MNKTKKLLIAVLLIIAVGAIVGYMLVNKPHRQVEDTKGISLTAKELAQAYTNDETTANEQYLDAALQVTGIVASTEQNQDGKLLVVLEEDIQCTMKDKVDIAIGSNVVIKGFCSGSSLFGVVLRDCVVVKE